MLHRRDFLKASVAATGSALLPAWTVTSLLAQASAASESSSVGAIAEWVGTRVGNQVATLAINHALGYLGLDPNGNVSGTVSEINQKLDHILSQLTVLNTKVDALASSIDQLTADVDVGIKESIAAISDAMLVQDYGWINTTQGNSSTQSLNSFYGLMHLPPTGTAAIRDRGNTFIQKRQQIWDKIHSIHYILTVQAGSSECLIQKWATLVTARLRQRGSSPDVSGYAAMYEAWFIQAIAYQIKAYTMLMFIAGNNTEQQSAIREEMYSLVGEECARYLDGLDRIVLSVAGFCPSGQTINTQLEMAWATGSRESMLRADILARALTVSFDGDSQKPQAQKISGVYGRIVLRPSDLTPDGKAPSHIAFTQYPGYTSVWPQPQQPGSATLGGVTEFQAIDWNLSTTAFASLKSGAQSAMRFGRYFWPVPAQAQGDINFQPFPYFIQHSADRPFRRNPSSGDTITNPRAGGRRTGTPFYRKDGRVSYFAIADMAPLSMQPISRVITFRYVNGTPVSSANPDPYVVLDKTCGLVIDFLDGWSGPGSGPRFSADAPRGIQQNPMAGSSYLSWDEVSVNLNHAHLLEYDTTSIRTGLENRVDPPPLPTLLDASAIIRCRWNDRPTINKRYNSFAGSQQDATSSISLPLFVTAPDESAAIHVRLKGSAFFTALSSVDGLGFGPSARLVIQSDRGDAYTMFTLNRSGDFGGELNFAGFTNGKDVPLKPDTRYSLVIAIDAGAYFSYQTGAGVTIPRFPGSGNVATKVHVIMTQFAISRAPGSGYRTA